MVLGPRELHVTAAPTGAQSGRVADRTLRLQMLRAAGYDEATANAIAANAVPTPNSMVMAYTNVQKMVSQDFTIPDEEKPAKVAATMQAMFGPDWLQRVQGRLPAPGAPPSPVPATIGPAARPPGAPPVQAAPAAPAPLVPAQVDQPVPQIAPVATIGPNAAPQVTPALVEANLMRFSDQVDKETPGLAPPAKAVRVAALMDQALGAAWRPIAKDPAFRARINGQSIPQPAPEPSPLQPPPGLPPGSAYSPSRRMWRDPNGRLYDQTGVPIGG